MPYDEIAVRAPRERRSSGRSRSRWRWLFDIAADRRDPRPPDPLVGAGSTAWRRAASKAGRPSTTAIRITLGAERIRLRGIDAPEFTQICRKDGADYPCGRRARDALAGLIGGEPVACTGWERDRYGRLLAACTAGGKDLNRELVEAGWAVAYGDFEAEEAAARQDGAGLWAGSFDRPRDWRDQHGGMAESEHGATGRILNWLRADASIFVTSGLYAEGDRPMEDRMKLFDGGRAPNPRRVRIFLAEKGIEVPLVPVDMGAMEHREDEVASRNPLQRLPVLELDDGTVLYRSRWRSAAISRSSSPSRRCSARARSARRRSRCGSAAWSSTCSCRWRRRSAISTRR